VKVDRNAVGVAFVVGGPSAVSVDMGRVFFVSVNQVLVRLWARLQTSSLTDKWVLRDPTVSAGLSGPPIDASGNYVQRRCGDPRLMRPSGPTCVC
jgi:hypothetical protein